MTLKQLQQFFRERPQLTALGFAKETGVSQRLIYYLINTNDRSLTNETIEKIRPTMVKYGYRGPK